MTVTNTQTGTNIAEIAEGIYRINTPLDAVPGGFSFNQYLIADDEPLLYHTGLRKLFPLVREAVAHVLPVEHFRDKNGELAVHVGDKLLVTITGRDSEGS